jgi:predicted  nucleic acid-binding Zn-ribbon protein
VNPDLRNLVALQDIELKIAVLQKQVSDIPNTTQNLENNQNRIKAVHEERVAHSKELGNRRRTLEGQVELFRTKLARLKEQLMSVKTNKEYTAMLHEIQTVEGQIRGEEDKILEVMEEMEGRDTELIRKTKESAPLLESELSRMREEKASLESRVERELLSRYRRIAEARKGVALAEAKEELCSVCHVRIRPQMYADLLRTENIQTCDSCSRILFSRQGL